MTNEKLERIKALEEELSAIIKPSMTIDEKIKALSGSFWRSHNAGFCDYIAGMLMGGIENGETMQYDWDCKYKWEVEWLLDLLKEYKEETK